MNENLVDLVHGKRSEILRLAAKHGASRVRLFGSVVRSSTRPESDIDFLVDMAPDRSLLDLVALGDDLEQLLGRNVDVLTADGISPYIRETILSEAVPL